MTIDFEDAIRNPEGVSCFQCASCHPFGIWGTGAQCVYNRFIPSGLLSLVVSIRSQTALATRPPRYHH